ncbi:MAG: hypothetical protein LC640_09195 [Frankia sp.]|nr:hypothetical protein [Frankia sp.]
MNRVFKGLRTLIPGQRIVHCKATTTTVGTLAAGQTNWGLKLTKTAGKTGRYTCQLVNQDGSNANAVAFVNAIVTVTGPDDAAYTDAKGIVALMRDDDIGTGANDGTIEVQFIDPRVSLADAELADGAIINISLYLRDSLAA